MFQLLTFETGVLTTNDAKCFLDMNTLDSQRNIRKDHVDYLANCIKLDTFLHADIAIAVLGKIKRLVNGQHTCEAVVKSERPVRMIFSQFQCNTEEDLALLFRQFDSNRVRTIAQKTVIEGSALGVSWPPTVMTLVCGAGAFLGGIHFAHANKKVENMKDYLRQGDFANNILTYHGEAGSKLSGRVTHIRRIGAVAAMMRTFEKDPAIAAFFWETVRDGFSNDRILSQNSPEIYLKTTLENIRVMHGGNALVNHKEVYAKCIYAWNKFRKSKELRGLQYQNGAKLPEPI